MKWRRCVYFSIGEMKTNGIKGILLVGVHLLIAIALVAGYEVSLAVVKQVMIAAKSNARTFSETVKDGFGFVTSQEPLVLYSTFGVIALIIYDIKVFFNWFFGFRFTSHRNCQRCKIRTVRAERQWLDRVVSMVYPVKRLLCLGCGRQYLMSERPRRKGETVPAGAESAFAPIPGSDPREVRNRFW